MAANPTIYKKLQRILDQDFTGGDREYSNSVGSHTPYLGGVIHEFLRLQPLIPSALPRETPPEGITIEGVYVPGSTIISVPVHAIGRDGRYYERPFEFVAERWTEEMPEPVRDSRVFMPFTLGLFHIYTLVYTHSVTKA